MRHRYHKTVCKICGRRIGANNSGRHARTHMTQEERDAVDAERRRLDRVFQRAVEIARRGQ